MDRSKALLGSLATERERWNAGSEAFRNQMSTISGDVLLTAAFMAYGGYFDQSFRHNLFTSWASHLQQAKINFRPDLARVEVCVCGGVRKACVWGVGGSGRRAYKYVDASVCLL